MRFFRQDQPRLFVVLVDKGKGHLCVYTFAKYFTTVGVTLSVLPAASQVDNVSNRG